MPEASGPPSYPRSTIRLQFNKDFTFKYAQSLVPYFSSLGISHIYGSPILKARPGSPHGYDITDHTKLNPEIGSEEEFGDFISELHTHGMGFIMDFVPNHMGVGGNDNEWWLDVLEWGKSSLYASFFDIDWNPAEQSLKGKVLLPVLGGQYGEILENGELKLLFDENSGSFSVWYYEHRFPITIKHYREILRMAMNLEPESSEWLRPVSQRSALIKGSQSQDRKQTLVYRRARELRQELREYYQSKPIVKMAVEKALREYNGNPGNRRSFDRLHKLLEQQSYRVSYWRVASNEINYRRFFDINDLAALRMENQDLFNVTHNLIFQFIREGKIQGLRIDHIDGIFDPQDYLERIQNRAAYLIFEGYGEFSAGRPIPGQASLNQPFYLLVEKILARHEHLREEWPVSGSTGYDFMNLVDGLFADPGGEKQLTEIYHGFTGMGKSYGEVVLDAKYRIMTTSLASELNVLANRFNRLAKQSRLTRDYSRIGFRTALADVVAHFPVYRTYVAKRGVDDADLRYLDWAVAGAKKDTTAADTSIYDFIHSVLSLKLFEYGSRGYRRQDVLNLAMSFQQFTGPVMAKSLEDTAFYRYLRFVARNEVGGDPSSISTSPQAFHLENKGRFERYPFYMLATATHDHKRGEDSRARMLILSEIPELWEEYLSHFHDIAGYFKRETEEEIPSKNDEYLLYQTLVGTWPFYLSGPEYTGIEEYKERIVSYMIKAAREAKLRTDWTAVNTEYEEGLRLFIDNLLDPKRSKAFLRSLEAILEKIAPPAALTGLSRLCLKLCSPGVPDIYQGTEYWDFSLVDPDNRRAVDYKTREKSLSAILSEPPSEKQLENYLQNWKNGKIKQLVCGRILSFRKEASDLFAKGNYVACEILGKRANNIVAFLRVDERHKLLVAVPRLTISLCREDVESAVSMLVIRSWEDTRIKFADDDDFDFTNIFTGQRHRGWSSINASELFSCFPLAVLTSNKTTG